MSLYSKLLSISEAVAINYKNQGRYNKYIELITKKFKVGKFVDESNIADGIEAIILGKTELKNHLGEYLYLVVNYNESKNEKSGFITHFGFSPSRNEKINQVTGGYEFSILGGRLIEIPKDFVKFEHIMALICNVGKINFRKTLGNEVKNIPNDEFLVQDINEKFELTAQTIRMVFKKALNGLIIIGSPGIGKTYTILQIFKDLGLEEDEDYYYVQGGKLTLTKFYQTMFENHDKILVFDDSDSVINNADGVNMLKAALDSNEKREITYNSPTIESMGLPIKFKFSGKCVFISNLPMSAIDSALKSRSIVMDLHMTRDEKLERIKSLTHKVMPNLILGDNEQTNTEMRNEVIEFLADFIDRYPNKPENLDIRTLNKLLEIRNGSDDLTQFKKIATNQLLHS